MSTFMVELFSWGGGVFQLSPSSLHRVNAPPPQHTVQLPVIAMVTVLSGPDFQCVPKLHKYAIFPVCHTHGKGEIIIV